MVMVLGIDIGGTGSRARLAVDGVVAAESEAGSASVPAAGSTAAEAALEELLAGLPLGDFTRLDAVCAGTAGLSVPGVAEFLRERLSPLAFTVEIVSDAALALSAEDLDDGVAIICGTGSIAIGSCQGRTAQAGGWGYLLGDEGSGYWIVREAIRMLLGRRDRGDPAGDLSAQLFAAADVADLAELHRSYYQRPHLPRQWAGPARVVVESGDPAAVDIVARGAGALAALAVTAVERLSGAAPLPVVLAGGLSGSLVYAGAVRRAVTAALTGAEFRVLAHPPVAGAVRLASRAAARGAGDPAR